MEGISRKDLKILRDLLSWDGRRKSSEAILYNLILTIGLIIIIISFYNTVLSLNDRTVLYITLPGFFSGLIMIWIYILGRRRFKERAALVTFLKNLIRNNKLSVSDLVGKEISGQ